MTIQIEEGKFYRTRDGGKAGPMRETGVSGLYHLWTDGSCTWARDGRYWVTASGFDLVAEWVDVPAPLVLEEGKFYRTRDGRKAGPLTPYRGPEQWRTYAFCGHVKDDSRTQNRVFQADGKHGSVAAGGVVANIPQFDLVEEWDASAHPAQPASIPELMQDLAATEKADVKAEIADEAKRIVSGARRTAYGTPESNFERIARFWQAYLENTGRGGAKITAADVSPMMRLMKEARLCETPDHRDSFVDLVGYTLTGAEVNGVKPLTADKPQA